MSDNIIENSIYDELERNPRKFLELSQDELFGLDWKRVEAMQLQLLKQRFKELRPKLRGLKRLAEEIEIDEVTSLADITRLGMPHTMFKSYSAADVRERRFEKLTKWLQSLTTHDLSGVESSGCESIEQWLQRLEAQTSLRPVTSSGTSGKISIFPVSTNEEDLFIYKNTIVPEPYGNEPGIDVQSGEYYFVCPWPSQYGRHNIPFIMRVIREQCYAGSEEKFITLGQGTLSADEMWLGGQLQRAEAQGEELNLTAHERQVAEALVQRQQGAADNWDKFVDKAVVDLKGKKVFFYGGWMPLMQMADACKRRGIVVEWHPDSMIMTGGGTKGFSFPPDWRERIDAGFPHHIPGRLKEVYGMTESSATAVVCAQGKLHPVPWGILHLMDPKTGQPLPREGTQSGRLAVFDPLPETFWAGTITGDAVTVHFDGGCSCGRNGPFLDNNISRLSELSGGDDKITCARTPQAFARLEEFLGAGA